MVNKLFNRHKNRDILLILTVVGIWSALPLFLAEAGNTFCYSIFAGSYSLICYILALIMSDVQDILWYKYKISIFYAGEDSYWKCDWRRKYKKNDPVYGHRQFTIPLLNIKMDIPSFWFVALKLVKIIEIWLEWTALYYLFHINEHITFYSLLGYSIFTTVASIITYYFHKWFFSGLLLKEK